MKQIKNIALLIPTLERGGMERVAADMSRMLEALGFNVYIFVTYYNKKNAYSHAGKVIKCYCTMDLTDETSEKISYFINAFFIKKLKKIYKIDATISFAPEMNLVNILTRGKDRKILTIHNCVSLRKDVKSLAYQKKYMILSNLAYKIIPVCNWCKEDLISNFYIMPSKLQVIYNQAQIREVHINCQKKNVILLIGRLEKIKQQWHGIKAFKCVLERIPEAELWIAGNGPDEEKLKKLVSNLNIENKVKFLGYVDDIQSLYSNAKILMLTSKSEAFPCVAVEALSYGVPIVAPYIPGGLYECMGEQLSPLNSYPIDMSAGYITSPLKDEEEAYNIFIHDEETELAEAIVYMLNNTYEMKVQGAYEAVKKFDIKGITRQWKELLTEEKER